MRNVTNCETPLFEFATPPAIGWFIWVPLRLSLHSGCKNCLMCCPLRSFVALFFRCRISRWCEGQTAAKGIKAQFDCEQYSDIWHLRGGIEVVRTGADIHWRLRVFQARGWQPAIERYPLQTQQLDFAFDWSEAANQIRNIPHVFLAHRRHLQVVISRIQHMWVCPSVYAPVRVGVCVKLPELGISILQWGGGQVFYSPQRVMNFGSQTKWRWGGGGTATPVSALLVSGVNWSVQVPGTTLKRVKVIFHSLSPEKSTNVFGVKDISAWTAPLVSLIRSENSLPVSVPAPSRYS